MIQSLSASIARSSSMLPAVTSFAARADMNAAGSVFSIFATALSASTLRFVAPSGTISSSSTGTPAFANCAAMPAPMTPAPMTVALRIGSMAVVLPLDSFEDRGDTLTAADALGRQRVTAAFTLQQTGRLADDASAGRAERMAECDCAAIDVEGGVANAEIPRAGERLAREGFVELDDIDCRNLEIRARQGLARGCDGADAHDFRRATGDRDAADPSQRLQTVLGCVIFAAHQHRGAAVGQRRRSAGSDAAAFRERRLELCETGGRRVRTGATVRIDRSALALDRHDFGGEAPRLDRGRGALLAAQCEGLLFGAADLPFHGDVFGSVPHADVGRRQLGLQHRIHQRIEAEHRHATHAFDAGGDEHLACAELNLAGGDMYRLHRRAAEAIYGHARDRLR